MRTTVAANLEEHKQEMFHKETEIQYVKNNSKVKLAHFCNDQE
jgi:hypothetical protein